MLKRLAIYPGTFDPITFGHLDIIRRAAKLFDQLIIAIAADTNKKTLFSLEERIEIAGMEIDSLNLDNIKILSFHGLLVDFASSQGAKIIIRGLRALADFEYEFQMAYINHKLSANIETIFIPSTEQGHFISSTFVKEIARLKGNLNGLVSKKVELKLSKYYESQV